MAPPRPGRGPRVVLAGGSQGREAREELFMFAGAKCLLGTVPAVPGPNYSTQAPPTTPARDQVRPTPPGWLLCTPVTPYSMLHTASRV